MCFGRRWPAAVIGGMLCFARSGAAEPRAESVSATLEVQSDEGTGECAEGAALAVSVERRLKRRVFVPRDGELRVKVSFARAGATFRALVELRSSDGALRGNRELTTSAAHCSALDDSLALVVALLVDDPPEPQPEAATASAGAETGSPSANAANAANAPPPAAPPPSRPHTLDIPPDVLAPREPWHLQSELGAAFDWGILPGTAIAGLLGLRLLPRGFVPLLGRVEL